jgi:hypothetical protein
VVEEERRAIIAKGLPAIAEATKAGSLARKKRSVRNANAASGPPSRLCRRTVSGSHLIWDKGFAGTSYWNRNQHQLLLIGTRGELPAPSPGTQPPSILRITRGPHLAAGEGPRDGVAAVLQRIFQGGADGPDVPEVLASLSKRRLSGS